MASDLDQRPPVQAPSSPPPRLSRNQAGLPRATVLALLAGMLLLGLLVIWFLPGMVSPPPAGEQAMAPVHGNGSMDRSTAERRLAELLRHRARLEAGGVAEWGGERFQSVLQQQAKGDEAFARLAFRDAVAAYEDALSALQRLASERTRIHAAALAAGNRAMEEGETEEALEQFSIALAADPADAEAAHGLQRVRTLQQVRELTDLAARQEAQGELKSALENYRRALKLEPRDQPALDGQARLTSVLEEREFRQAMSRLLSRLDADDLKGAREAAKAARALRRDAPELRDAMTRLAVMEKAARLRALRRRAEQEAAGEQWSKAAQTYRQALAVDPNAEFAQSGLQRAERYLRLFRNLDRYLDDPGRLAEDGPLANAQALLAEARLADPGPRLRQRMERLQRLLDMAARRVPVFLKSDGETEVLIYHVGRLGRFKDYRLELRPGNYTAMGSRDGYRDVRIRFTVTAEGGMEPVLIRCEEML